MKTAEVYCTEVDERAVDESVSAASTMVDEEDSAI